MMKDKCRKSGEERENTKCKNTQLQERRCWEGDVYYQEREARCCRWRWSQGCFWNTFSNEKYSNSKVQNLHPLIFWVSFTPSQKEIVIVFVFSGVCHPRWRRCIWLDQHPEHPRQVPTNSLHFFNFFKLISPSKMGNRRTANVRSVGYTDLFSLSKVKKHKKDIKIKKKLWKTLQQEKRHKTSMLFTSLVVLALIHK